MGNIMHKDKNHLKVKQINWQDIGRNKQGKNVISFRKEMHPAQGTRLQD